MAERFIETFVNLNADIAKNIPVIRRGGNLLDLALSTTRENAIPNMGLLMDTLKSQTEYAVLYIFDEHNEFWKRNDSGSSPLQNHSEFLNRFTRWTAETGGVSILLLLPIFHRICSGIYTNQLYPFLLFPIYRSERSQYILAQLILYLRIICQQENGTGEDTSNLYL